MTTGTGPRASDPPSRPTVALVDLGRTNALGARGRRLGLRASLDLLGADTVELAVLPHHRSGAAEVLRRLPAVVRGRVTPESLAWSPQQVRAELDRLHPAVVICETSRTFDPALVGPWLLALDLVDRLSVSYGDRVAHEPSPLKRWRYRALARPQRRFEARLPPGVDLGFAAGRRDADELGLAWVPIVVAEQAVVRDPDRFDVDLAFVGTLDYPPNVEAVDHLDRLWPALRRRRPDLRVLIAGARPVAAVREAAARNGWELLADFADVGAVYPRVRIAVAPLVHASGIQNKVMEATSWSVPLIVSPVVTEGLDPDYPVRVATDERSWVDAVDDLVGDPEAAGALADRARRHLATHYTPAAGAELLRSLLGPALLG
ncbi:MAG: glycosyltransferase [Acidimicrobiales bacterium]